MEDVSDDRAAARAAEVLGLLAEEDRLRVVGVLALDGPSTLAAITQRTGLERRRAYKATHRLVDRDLVDLTGETYRLRTEEIRDVARAATPERPVEEHGAADPGAEQILRRFFADGALLSIPAAHAKRLVVLDHIVRVFEPGVRYAEREVDTLLRAFHDDYVTLRRYLIDAGLLSRESGVYWRSGGTVSLD
jgi:hypothetical protein